MRAFRLLIESSLDLVCRFTIVVECRCRRRCTFGRIESAITTSRRTCPSALRLHPPAAAPSPPHTAVLVPVAVCVCAVPASLAPAHSHRLVPRPSVLLGPLVLVSLFLPLPPCPSPVPPSRSDQTRIYDTHVQCLPTPPPARAVDQAQLGDGCGRVLRRPSIPETPSYLSVDANARRHSASFKCRGGHAHRNAHVNADC
jgi:hypothetical protein